MNEPFLNPRYYSRFTFWIVGHLLKNKYYFFASYLFLFFSTLITVSIPLVLKQFFDYAIYEGQESILFTALSFLGLYFLSFIISMFNSASNVLSNEYTVRNVQEEFYISIHDKNMTFHDTSRAGNLLSMATSDSRQLSWMLTSVRLFSVAIVTTIGVIISMYFLEIRLMVLFFLFLPFIIFSIFSYGKNISPVSLERQKLFGEWQATLQENLAGIRALRTLSNRDREYQKYLKDLVAVRDILIRRAKIQAKYFPTLILYFSIGIIFIIGSYFVYIKDISPGTLIAFNSLIFLLFQPNRQIRSSFFLGSMGFAGGQRVYSVITNQFLTQDGTKVDKSITGHIEFKNVNFRYQTLLESDRRDLYTLKNITFKINAGESIALIGHTGCGKTTLTKLIQRLYEPEGIIEIDGENIKNYELDTLRRQIGVIEQDIFLFSASIRENILFGYGGNITHELEDQMIQVAKAARIHDFILSLPKGYDTIIGERGMTLSGGQRQRIAIARAFMIDPPILILDDATSSVDADTESQIQMAISNLVKKRTSIIITHRLSTLLKANRILLMDRGEIIDFGSHQELYNRQPSYASIFKQFENLPIIPNLEVI
jgi:ATP-binding cassette subfamily B protein